MSYTIGVQVVEGCGDLVRELLCALLRDLEAAFLEISEKITAIEAMPAMDQIKAIVVGWRGCKDVDGQDVPFTEQALVDLVTEFPEVMALFFQAFHESWSIVKRKN